VLRSVPEEAHLQHDEIFGPVTIVVSFSDLDEVVSGADPTDFGLAAYVLAERLRPAMALAERLEAGMVFINLASASGVHARRAASRKQSGIRLRGGSAGVDEFAYQKDVSIGL
jgi:succinate-semialdehyde dehydrogenase / glutarate-semialdehyde dehydrogenase